MLLPANGPMPAPPPDRSVLPPRDKRYSRLDLELLHFFATQTYMTMTSKLTVHAVWRDVVFDHALRYDFLLQALMATAALHKATGFVENSQPHIEYTKAAFMYQDLALQGYIPELNKPTELNAVALFILSTLLTVWLFATKKLPESLSETDAAVRADLSRPRPSAGTSQEHTDIVEILTRVQGINAVFKQTIHWLYQSAAKPMLSTPTDADLPRTIPENIEHSFTLLRQRLDAACQSLDQSTQDRYKMYLERFEHLRMVSRSRTVLEWDQFIFSWPVTVEPAFIELIRQQDAVAIALFIHWAACFKMLEHMWWARGWSFRLVRDACVLLDSTWNDVVAWPRKEVGLD